MKLLPRSHRSILKSVLLVLLSAYLPLFGPVISSLHICEHQTARLVGAESFDNQGAGIDASSHNPTACPTCQQGGTALGETKRQQGEFETSELLPRSVDQNPFLPDAPLSLVSLRSPPVRIA